MVIRFFSRAFLSLLNVGVFFQTASAQAQKDGSIKIPYGTPLQLLEPLDGATRQLPASKGIQILIQYFNLSWPWIVGVSSGIAVFWGLLGGIMVIFSGGDQGKRQEGIGKLISASVGLLLLALAGFVLRVLNSVFYQ